MAAEDVRPDPLRASNSNVAKDHLHGLTLELDGVLPAPFQLAGANGPKEKRHARSERPTFAEPLVLPVSSQPSDPAPLSPPAVAKPRPRRMSALGGRGRGKHEARTQVLKSRVSAMFEECIEIANYRLVKTKLETQAQIQQPMARSIASAWPGSVPALQRLLPLKPSQDEVVLEPRGKVTKNRQITLPLQRIETLGGDGLATNDAEVLHWTFQEAMAEARRIQTQAIAAKHEVKRLQSAIAALQRRAKSPPPLPPLPSSLAASPQVSARYPALPPQPTFADDGLPSIDLPMSMPLPGQRDDVSPQIRRHRLEDARIQDS
eukprot:s56_g21.t1